jgi:outer membrane protein OmpA-like peptidoglycan-associated protein
VITLSGSVLFATGKSELLATASARLGEVADALADQPERGITVVGHTDAQGDDSYNLKLSERRAEAVRTYLISRGIAADRVKAVGRGKTEPIADNNSPEGRANNRRVEIVLAPNPNRVSGN